ARARPRPRRSGLPRRRSAGCGIWSSVWSGGFAQPAAGRMLMNAERAVFVYTTYPSLVEAERVGKAVLERGLAACVNILPGVISQSAGEGAIAGGEAGVMISTARASLAERVRTLVKVVLAYAA